MKTSNMILAFCVISGLALMPAAMAQTCTTNTLIEEDVRIRTMPYIVGSRIESPIVVERQIRKPMEMRVIEQPVLIRESSSVVVEQPIVIKKSSGHHLFRLGLFPLGAISVL